MPVTMTGNVPLVVGVHDSVEVPDPPVTLVGVRVHVIPAGTDEVRATVPANPFTGAMVIVEVPA